MNKTSNFSHYSSILFSLQFKDQNTLLIQEKQSFLTPLTLQLTPDSPKKGRITHEEKNLLLNSSVSLKSTSNLSQHMWQKKIVLIIYPGSVSIPPNI